MRKSLISLLVAAGALTFDLATKAWVREALLSQDGVNLTPFLALRVMFNDGTTFGFLSGRTAADLMVLVAVTVAVVTALGWWSLRSPQNPGPRRHRPNGSRRPWKS